MVELPTIHALGEVIGTVLEVPSCGLSPKTVFGLPCGQRLRYWKKDHGKSLRRGFQVFLPQFLSWILGFPVCTHWLHRPWRMNVRNLSR